jgi:hypothetical protein
MVSVSRRAGLPQHGAGDDQRETFVLVQRVAAAVGNAVLRQHHRQVLFGHGHRAVFEAVDDGNGRAPVALARDAPVAQAPGGLFLAQALGGQRLRHGVDRVLMRQAAEVVGVDGHALLLVGVPVVPAGVVIALAVDVDHLLDRQAVLEREGEVALVVRRHAHHGAVAVAHQHVVADPQRHRLAGQRVRDHQAGGHALLVLGGQFGLGGAALPALVDEGGELRVGRARRAWPAGARAPRRRRSRP